MSWHRFGFQGQETDKELYGEGNAVNYKYRMHDPRVGRFFAVDPLAPKYPHNSPYAFSENVVIDHIELEGLEKAPTPDKKTNEDDPGIFDGSKPLGEVVGDYVDELAKSLTISSEPDPSLPSEVAEKLPLGGRKPREARLPDLIALDLGADFVPGMGASYSFEIVYIRGQGLGIVGNTGGGVGVDFDASCKLKVAWCSGDPTFESYTEGVTLETNMGYSFADAQVFGSYDELNKRVGDNWSGVSFGIGLGADDITPWQASGSQQVSIPYIIAAPEVQGPIAQP